MVLILPRRRGKRLSNRGLMDTRPTAAHPAIPRQAPGSLSRRPRPSTLSQCVLREARANLSIRLSLSQTYQSRRKWVTHQLESRMREIRQSGSEGGVAGNGHPYPYIRHPTTSNSPHSEPLRTTQNCSMLGTVIARRSWIFRVRRLSRAVIRWRRSLETSPNRISKASMTDSRA